MLREKRPIPTNHETGGDGRGRRRERVAVNANIDGLIDWIAEIPPNESDREVR